MNGTRPIPDPNPPADCANAGEIIIDNPFRVRDNFKEAVYFKINVTIE